MNSLYCTRPTRLTSVNNIFYCVTENYVRKRVATVEKKWRKQHPLKGSSIIFLPFMRLFTRVVEYVFLKSFHSYFVLKRELDWWGIILYFLILSIHSPPFISTEGTVSPKIQLITTKENLYAERWKYPFLSSLTLLREDGKEWVREVFFKKVDMMPGVQVERAIFAMVFLRLPYASASCCREDRRRGEFNIVTTWRGLWTYKDEASVRHQRSSQTETTFLKVQHRNTSQYEIHKDTTRDIGISNLKFLKTFPFKKTLPNCTFIWIKI